MVNIESPVTNQVKQCKVGWSWTVFFFGFFPMLFRQDWKWLLITLVVALLGLFTFGIVSFIANVILAVLYNKFYLTDLVNAGWRPVDEASKNLLLAKGIVLTESAKPAEKSENQDTETLTSNLKGAVFISC